MTVSKTSHALLKTTSSRLGFVAGQTPLELPTQQSSELYAAANFCVNRLLAWCSPGVPPESRRPALRCAEGHNGPRYRSTHESRFLPGNTSDPRRPQPPKRGHPGAIAEDARRL